MIAVLYKNGKVGAFIENVTAIDGDTVESVGGSARGVTHDIIVLDSGHIRFDRIETARIPYTEWEPDEQGMPQPIPKENVLYTDIPVLVTAIGEFKAGDEFDPTAFTDQRSKLGKTEKQIALERTNKLEADNALLQQELAIQKDINTANSQNFMDLVDYLTEKGVLE